MRKCWEAGALASCAPHCELRPQSPAHRPSVAGDEVRKVLPEIYAFIMFNGFSISIIFNVLGVAVLGMGFRAGPHT